MNLKSIINILCGGVIFCVCACGGYYGYEAYESHIINVTEQSFQNGYKSGFSFGKENVEKILHHEYQNFLYQIIDKSAMSNNYHDDAVDYIAMESRIERIMMKSNPKLSEQKKNLYKQYIMKWAYTYELSPVFVASIIHRETNFNEHAVSKSNARGPMQVLYKYHKDKCAKLGIEEKDLHSINHGVNVGCQIIKQYLEWNDWNYRAALKKYVGAVNNSADGYINDIFMMTMYAYEKE